MNILYIPQLSMYDKQTGKFLPKVDGNLNMMRNFIDEWLKYRSDVFYCLVPETEELVHWLFDTYPLNDLVNFIGYTEYVVSARINRFNFPMKEIIEVIGNEFKYDLVICDIPELSRNIRAMFNVSFGYEPKIISNIHHVDDPSQEKSSYDYLLRLADGIDCSDACTILSDSMADILMHDLDLYFKGTYVDLLMSKIYTFEPSVRLVELFPPINPYKIWNKPYNIITFPGRLSKGEEKRTNWDKFQQAIQELRKQRQDFVVYFTDPNNNKDFFDFSPKDWVFTIDKDRNKYLELLYNTDIIVSLMDIQGFGGISIREAINFSCLPIIPYKHEYKNMQNNIYMGYLYEITVEELVRKLNWALDNYDTFNKQMQRNYGHKFTIEEQMPKLLAKLGGILNG